MSPLHKYRGACPPCPIGIGAPVYRDSSSTYNLGEAVGARSGHPKNCVGYMYKLANAVFDIKLAYNYYFFIPYVQLHSPKISSGGHREPDPDLNSEVNRFSPHYSTM